MKGMLLPAFSCVVPSGVELVAAMKNLSARTPKSMVGPAALPAPLVADRPKPPTTVWPPTEICARTL
ncbi:hypothetical protein D3C87_2176180 [compost metagenome]